MTIDDQTRGAAMSAESGARTASHHAFQSDAAESNEGKCRLCEEERCNRR